MLQFVKDVLYQFIESNTFQKGASLAYYAVFSMLPIIIIITTILGIFFGKQAVSGEIYAHLKDILGSDASMQIQNFIKNQHANQSGFFTSIIGFVTLGFSATAIFNQIHKSFNSIWGVMPKPKNSILNYLFKHLVSFMVLTLLFLIMLVSTAVNSFLIKHASAIDNSNVYWHIYEHLLSFSILSIIFAIMFKFLGDAKIHWKVALIGGALTTVLFLLGKVAIELYIGHSNVSSTFGSASVLALLMIWVYYTSQIIFLGASFIKVLSDRLGYEIEPKNDAVKIKKIEISN